ncbi:MAG: adenylate/guanylate cyclase domain-containing protein [Alphaproteobacteria bacterium]|nr:adenylate/guanylate cyclase domain-containing protein [Alphaproteobacteria bacterium]
MAVVDGLFVVLAADVVDYSRLIREDKEGTLERLKAHRDQLLHPKVRENCGRIVRVAGGSLLAEFTDPTAAVQCAVELQRGMIARNAGTAPNRRIAYRVSVNIGETTSPSDDLVLRAVAALPVDQLARLIKPGSEDCGERGSAAMRTAELAEPGGICSPKRCSRRFATGSDTLSRTLENTRSASARRRSAVTR